MGHEFDWGCLDGFVCKWVSHQIFKKARAKHKSISWNWACLSVCLFGGITTMSVCICPCLSVCLSDALCVCLLDSTIIIGLLLWTIAKETFIQELRWMFYFHRGCSFQWKHFHPFKNIRIDLRKIQNILPSYGIPISFEFWIQKKLLSTKVNWMEIVLSGVVWKRTFTAFQRWIWIEEWRVKNTGNGFKESLWRKQ